MSFKDKIRCLYAQSRYLASCHSTISGHAGSMCRYVSKATSRSQTLQSEVIQALREEAKASSRPNTAAVWPRPVEQQYLEPADVIEVHRRD